MVTTARLAATRSRLGVDEVKLRQQLQRCFYKSRISDDEAEPATETERPDQGPEIPGGPPETAASELSTTSTRRSSRTSRVVNASDYEIGEGSGFPPPKTPQKKSGKKYRALVETSSSETDMESVTRQAPKRKGDQKKTTTPAKKSRKGKSSAVRESAAAETQESQEVILISDDEEEEEQDVSETSTSQATAGGKKVKKKGGKK